MINMDEATFQKVVTMRPFAFTEFVFLPLFSRGGNIYHRDQCERIRPGRFGVVIVDHEDSESDYHVLGRSQTNQLLAIGYHSLAGYVPVYFQELPEAKKFLTHLQSCQSPELAPKHIFEATQKNQENLNNDDAGNEDMSDDELYG